MGQVVSKPGAGGVLLAGDLSGTAASPIVSKLRGATVPASPGAGDVGEGLVVSAASTLVYAPIPTFLCFAAANLGSSTAARYLSMRGGDGVNSTPDPGVILFPVPGVAYALYVFLGTALVTANVTVTLMKGANVAGLADTGLTVTVNATNTTGLITAATASFNAGEICVLKSVASASDGTACNIRAAVAWRPV